MSGRIRGEVWGVNRLRAVVWGAVAALMILPVVALRATDAALGDPADYLFLGILFGGVVGAYELAARVSGRTAYPVAAGLALAVLVLHAWINLAVGIVGSENNPMNLLYGGVAVVAVIGALIARFQPLGMSRAMIAGAIAQIVIFAIMLITGSAFTGPITIFFAALLLISAWLFRKASHEARPRHLGGASRG
jgi:hypothetical protein